MQSTVKTPTQGDGGTYTYQPLEEPATIRVLELQPGSGNDPLRGRLRHMDFDNFGNDDINERGFQSYEALSYVWGKPTFENPICLSESTLLITPSLHGALRRLRHETEMRRIWADAICINQQDLKERERQVKMMGRVYTDAERVLIYLGEDDSGHGQSFQLLQQHGKLGYPLRYHLDNWQAYVRNILKNEWFSRIWVVQELFLAREALFLWGDEQLEADILKDYVSQYDRQRESTGLRWISRNFQLSGGTAKFHFLDILYDTRSSLCTDNRDRIYGILGLTYDNSVPISSVISRIQPDYSRSVESLFIDVAVLCVENGELRSLLIQVEHHTADVMSLPSWVCDWSRPSRCTPLIEAPDPYFKGEPGEPFPYYETVIEGVDHVLNVTGIEIGDISRVTDLPLDTAAMADTIASIALFWSHTIKPMRHSEKLRGNTLGYAEADARFAQHFANNTWSYNNSFDWKQLAKAMFGLTDDHEARKVISCLENDPSGMDMMLSVQASLKECNGHEPTSVNRLYAPVVKNCWRGRRLFQTSNGYLGMAPETVRVDDLLLLFSGNRLKKSPFPVILRKSGKDHVFVGVAHVPGLQHEKIREMWLESQAMVKQFTLV